MTKITRPLFSDEARGQLGDLGVFRMGRHGPELIEHARGDGGKTEQQKKLRACFKAAKAAHSAIEPQVYYVGKKKLKARSPSWPDFWRQWLIDHPECLE